MSLWTKGQFVSPTKSTKQTVKTFKSSRSYIFFQHDFPLPLIKTTIFLNIYQDFSAREIHVRFHTPVAATGGILIEKVF